MLGSGIRPASEETVNILAEKFKALSDAAGKTMWKLDELKKLYPNSNMTIHDFSPIPEGFFGESGLTETSANHIANLAKLHYESLKGKIEAISFVEARAQIVGSDKSNVIKKANVIPTVEIVSNLDRISAHKGFIAFLREAITAKEVLMREIENYESPERANILEPKQEQPITRADVIVGWSIGERERYLSLEARASTYGEYIHPGGSFDSARRDAISSESEPTKLAQGGFTGRDTIIIDRKLKASLSDISVMMDSLQAEHRKSEAELNGMKHTIDEAIRVDSEEKAARYKVAYDEFIEKMQKIRIAENETKMARAKEVAALRIVIPKRYAELYKQLTNQKD
jgi:hypothetical protein